MTDYTIAVLLLIMAGLAVCGSPSTIMAIGKPRKSITPGYAATHTVITALFVTLYVIAASRLGGF